MLALPEAVKKAVKLSKFNFISYAHLVFAACLYKITAEGSLPEIVHYAPVICIPPPRPEIAGTQRG